MKPKSRVLHHEFFQDDELWKLDPNARWLFAGLWCLADRAGKLEDKPAVIKGLIFPHDNSVDVDQLLTLLHESCFIIRYEISGGHYVYITNFLKWQKPHPKEAVYPFPEIPFNLIELHLIKFRGVTPSGETNSNTKDRINSKDKEERGIVDGKHPVSREDVLRVTEKLRYLGDWAVVVNSMNGSARWVSTLIDKFGEDRVVSAADSILAYYTNKGLFPPKDLAEARTRFWNWCDRQRVTSPADADAALLEWAMKEDGDEPKE